MVYVKTPTGKRVPFTKLHFVTICPACGKEVNLPEFMELYAEMPGDFDEYSSTYCDECGQEIIKGQGFGEV